MYRTEQRVNLVASDEVNARLRALAYHVGTEFGAISTKCPKIDESERKSAMQKFDALLVHFINEAGNDLGIHPPLHTIEEWDKIVETEKSRPGTSYPGVSRLSGDVLPPSGIDPGCVKTLETVVSAQ